MRASRMPAIGSCSFSGAVTSKLGSSLTQAVRAFTAPHLGQCTAQIDAAIPSLPLGNAWAGRHRVGAEALTTLCTRLRPTADADDPLQGTKTEEPGPPPSSPDHRDQDLDSRLKALLAQARPDLPAIRGHPRPPLGC